MIPAPAVVDLILPQDTLAAELHAAIIFRNMFVFKRSRAVRLRVAMAKRDRPAPTHHPSLLGTNLRRLRRDRGLSQRALARLTNGQVVQGDISRIESGATQDPGFEKIKPLADALGVNLNELWGGGPAVEDSLARFLASELGEDATEQEIAVLKRVVIPWGIPTVKSWYHILAALRTVKPS